MYKQGDIVKGKVTGIENYGIFLSLKDGSTGLIHISEISDSFVRNILDYAELDEEISAKVLEYDESTKKLKLSVKGIKYRDSKKMNGINETKSGFTNLEKELQKWIEYKVNEININNQKISKK